MPHGDGPEVLAAAESLPYFVRAWAWLPACKPLSQKKVGSVAVADVADLPSGDSEFGV